MAGSNNPDFILSKKVRRFASRVVRTPLGVSRKKFCYVHIPKCGGNSVALAFIDTVPLTRSFTWVAGPETRRAVSISRVGAVDEARFHDDGPNGHAVYAFRRDLATTAMELGHEYVGGHFLFDAHAHAVHGDDYAWVTILRDPIARLVSHYREERRSGFVDSEIDEYLETPMAAVHGSMITRYLSGWGSEDGDNKSPEKLTDAAIANLSKFAVVGFLGDLSEFSNQVSTLAGKSLRIGHSRSGVARMPDLNDETLERVHEICRSDLQVFAAARERFG